MTAEEFLENVLAEQAAETDSDEHADLIEEHDSIATLLARELPDASPGVELGGSLAKGTMVRASFDLDSICYFDNANRHRERLWLSPHCVHAKQASLF